MTTRPFIGIPLNCVVCVLATTGRGDMQGRERGAFLSDDASQCEEIPRGERSEPRRG
jgi:hypothetical protein